VRTCANATAVNAVFVRANAGATVTGVCIPGYGPAAGAPTRACLLSGAWDTPVGQCERTPHLAPTTRCGHRA
jgi:hypothetical protein